MSLKEDRSERAQFSPRVLSGRVKSHTEKRLLSAKARKTSFIKLTDLKLFQERKNKELRPGVQQQPESGPMSEEFC